MNDGIGWIETVYVSTDAQPPTVYSCVMLPVEPEPHATSNVPAPVPVTWLPETDKPPVVAGIPELPEMLIVCEPAPATVYVAVVPAHGIVAAPIPAPVMLKSPATGDAVTVTAIDVVA